MPLDRLAAYYLIAQGLAGLAWWALLLLSPTVRDLFFPSTAGWLAGRTLLIADVVMFGVMSVAAGASALRNHRWAAACRWVSLGATAYATLVAAGWLMEPIGHWLGLTVMIPTLLATVASVWILHEPASTTAPA